MLNSADVKNLISLLRNEFTGGTAELGCRRFQEEGPGITLSAARGSCTSSRDSLFALNGIVTGFSLAAVQDFA